MNHLIFNCQNCKEFVNEVCPDGYCKNCHKSVSWQDCCDGTYTARNLLKLGHSKKEILEIFPEARIK